MKWLDNFFLPGPVKRALAELRTEEFRARREIDQNLHSVFHIMRKPLEQAIAGNPNSTQKKLKQNKLSPKHLAYIVLADVTESQLTSGSFHLSRGRMTQEGLAMLTLWHHTIDKLEKAGLIERDRVARIRRDLHEKILQVG